MTHAASLWTSRMAESKAIDLSNVLIRHPQFQQAHRSLSQFLVHARNDRGEARCAMLTGPTRTGKTTMARMIASEVNRVAKERVAEAGRFVADGDFTARLGPPPVSVVYVETPSGATPKTLAEAILVAMKDPISVRGSQARISERVSDILRNNRIELLILDEFHHLISSKSNKRAFETAEWVKSLLNKGVCPILLVGVEVAEKVMDENGQLHGRCWTRVQLPAFEWEPVGKKQHDFERIVRALMDSLKIPFDLNKDDKNMAEAMHRASGGLIGNVAILLQKADQVRRALTHGRITPYHLVEAYRDWIGIAAATKRQNPFESLLPTSR